jgi:hypothetical protein
MATLLMFIGGYCIISYYWLLYVILRLFEAYGFEGGVEQRNCDTFYDLQDIALMIVFQVDKPFNKTWFKLMGNKLVNNYEKLLEVFSFQEV